jgi:hypothetical protein
MLCWSVRRFVAFTIRDKKVLCRFVIQPTERVSGVAFSSEKEGTWSRALLFGLLPSLVRRNGAVGLHSLDRFFHSRDDAALTVATYVGHFLVFSRDGTVSSVTLCRCRCR